MLDIEELAVSTIKKKLSRTEHLDAKGITSGDRGPSLDGEILVYKDTGRTKKDLDGSVSVQVKGVTFTDEFPEKEISFDVEVSDLRNILHHGGALFFVVYINQDSEKIYCRRLAPFDVNDLLKDLRDNQKTKRIKLKPFPEDLNEISSELISFLHDCRKQTLVTDGRNKTVEEISAEIDPGSLEYKIYFTGVGYKDKNPIEFFLNHDAYIYLENKNLNISFPLERLPQSDVVEEKKYRNTGIGDTVYFDSVILRYSKEKEETLLGSCIRFIYDKNDGSFKLIFKARGNLQDRLLGEQFLYDLFTRKDMVVNGYHIPFPFDDEEINRVFDIKQLKQEIEFFNELKQTLEYYGAHKPLEIESITLQDLDTIKALIKARKHGSVKLKETNVEGLQRIKIGNLNLLLYLRKIDDNEYTIDSFFKVSVPTYASDGDRTIYTSQFVMMSVEDLLLSSNKEYKRISEEVSLFNDADHFEQIRHMMLRMLCAYDVRPTDDMFNCILQIARKLKRLDTCEACSDVNMINIIQCNSRKRCITKKEKQTLKRIAQSKETQMDLQVAANLLLGNLDIASKCYALMDAEEKELFDQYPINKFWGEGEQSEKYLQKYKHYQDAYNKGESDSYDWQI